MAAAIETFDLARSYTRKRGWRRSSGEQTVALRGIGLEVRQGEVRGLLGPNGAGKTTLVKILSTVLLPTGGRALVLGRDVVAQADRLRPRIGIVFGGERGLYGRLTARENLDYWASLYGAASRRALVDQLLARVGLSDRGDMQVDQLSRGMKQRLHLARGLVGGPSVLFLDEPTVGMDPVSAREFRNLVGELQADGITILMTTHDMREAEAVCDRVTLIDRGQVVGTEAPSEVGRWVSAYERVDARDVPASVKERLRGMKGVLRVDELPEGWTRIATNQPHAAGDVLRALVDADVTTVHTSLPSLEDVYLELVGNRGLSV
ncbi:daunorubicin resistance protein DrrA family ABC transporter ATP-binding protein [Streptomyces filipinensis]|uniref:Daunorubicin resistance protein DrrA family ABC transporter ATP-binding protein n=1 Tax=Streptomyces filipinensis TaxID=66887 RepID=A0A918I6T2_9ACTN|nr:ABC transporter ATP-binding protein [Streptomyces filipinensis]GGU81740.1 daunorubicin resistance protein DrrA family ABC transporter ATP-binding protein [Streptomyces filipinensis]